MIGTAAAWRLLGIARTADRSAIRRAYADKLRAMDPDADPDGFARLREARDAALATAASLDTAPPDVIDPAPAEPVRGIADLPITAPVLDVAASGTVGAAPAVSTTPLRFSAATPDSARGEDLLLPTPRPITPVLDRAADSGGFGVLPPTAIAAAYDCFSITLLPGGEHSPWALDADEQAALHRAINVIQRDPRLDELSFRDQAANWTAGVAADAIPRSDPILGRLAELFGWQAQAGTIGEAPAVARVTERLDTLSFVEAVSRPGHKLHGAWKELTTPARERSRRGWVRRGKVDALLKEVRERHPDAEGWFDGYRVGLWENVVRGPRGSVWLALGAVMAFRLLVMMADVGGDHPAPSASTDLDLVGPSQAGLGEPLSDMDRNLTSSLLTLGGGYTAARVKAENPDLYSELAALWREQKAKDGRINDLDRAVAAYFDERHARAAQAAPLALAIALQRNAVNQLEYARRTYGDASCAAMLGRKGSAAPNISNSLASERFELLNRVIFAVPPSALPAKLKSTYRLPADIVGRLRERLGWNADRFDAALRGTGPAPDICRAEIGLRAMVLDKPSASDLPLLRTM